MKNRLAELEKAIGYIFQNQGYLSHALTHSSYANEKKWKYEKNNERLEFLGDAVLELVSSEFLYDKMAENTEGVLTKTRASLVCEPSLASSARELQLGSYVLLGKGEAATGGAKRDSILSDAFEAIIGAIYLDGGYEPAKAFVLRYVLTDIEKKQLFYDSKTILQETVQAMPGKKVSYELVNEDGPDHAKTFTVNCMVDKEVLGTGSGRSKKNAEQKAAYEALLKLKSEC